MSAAILAVSATRKSGAKVHPLQLAQSLDGIVVYGSESVLSIAVSKPFGRSIPDRRN